MIFVFEVFVIVPSIQSALVPVYVTLSVSRVWCLIVVVISSAVDCLTSRGVVVVMLL